MTQVRGSRIKDKGSMKSIRIEKNIGEILDPLMS
jgi:hypothetical protein